MTALKKVLVVDDDPSVIKSFDRVLGRKGCVVVGAETGPEALNKAASEDYDAIFTDIRMPGMDGIEVAERLRAKRPWTPVVIITGYGTADHEARAEAAGVSGFLRKPLSPDMIEDSLEAAMATPPAPAAAMLPAAAVAVAPEPVATLPAAVGEESARWSTVVFLKNIGMFFAAPFIALAYITLFPFIGLGMLVVQGGRAWRKRGASG
jgi:CheY-like chemotaxis protein